MSNNSMAATKLKKSPRLMSLALRAIRECESKGQNVTLQIMGEDKFKVVNLVQGKPQENPELEKIVTPILAEKNWAKYEKGWVVLVKEEKAVAPALEPEKKKADK